MFKLARIMRLLFRCDRWHCCFARPHLDQPNGIVDSTSILTIRGAACKIAVAGLAQGTMVEA